MYKRRMVESRILIIEMKRQVLLLLFLSLGISSVRSADGSCDPNSCTKDEEKRWNIIVIMADDMGLNNMGCRGSDKDQTPNMDALALCGIVLDRFYGSPMCTPSRAAFLTGLYSSHTGLQDLVAYPDQPGYCYLHNCTLITEFKKCGYTTRMVGKAHTGSTHKIGMPTELGFDSFYGYLQGCLSYYNHEYCGKYPDSSFLLTPTPCGHDFWINQTPHYPNPKTYLTRLLCDEVVRLIKNHDTSGSSPLFLYFASNAPHAGCSCKSDRPPLEVPLETYCLFNCMEDSCYKNFSAMVYELDCCVGRIVQALHETNMLDDTIIVFVSDNGGATQCEENTCGDNGRLRGQKRSVWEGALRTPGFIYSPRLATQGTYKHPIPMYDILPTLLAAVGCPCATDVKGTSHWNSINNCGEEPPRTDHFLAHDTLQDISAMICGDLKVIDGASNNEGDNGYHGSKPSDAGCCKFDCNAVINSPTGKILKSRCNSCLTCDYINERRDALKIDCGSGDPQGPPVNCKAGVGCCFNLTADPCERFNIMGKNPQCQDCYKKLLEHKKLAVPTVCQRKSDSRAFPCHFCGIWSPWQDLPHSVPRKEVPPDTCSTVNFLDLIKCVLLKESFSDLVLAKDGFPTCPATKASCSCSTACSTGCSAQCSAQCSTGCPLGYSTTSTSGCACISTAGCLA